MELTPYRRFAACGLLLLAAALIPGCSPEKPAPAEQTAQPVSGPPELVVLVVDDPEMSAAIEGLKAEWKARTGTAIQVSQTTSGELLGADKLPRADAIIYAPRLIGRLVTKQQVARLPAEFARHQELAWSDLFETLQTVESTWGEETYGVPLGSPVLTLYYRADLLAARHKGPPQDWKTYHELADELGRRENLQALAPPSDVPWHGSLQPLGEGWAGRTLLARAAPYVKHRDHFSALFDIESMTPLIANEGFVRALEELRADYRLGPPEQIEMDPAAVRAEFLAGRCAFALAWPGHAGERASSTPSPVATGFAELPGSPVVHNFAHSMWEKRQSNESTQVPALGLSGRMGSVTTSTVEPAAAFQLLAWLAGREWGTRVSSASSATTLYRRSQMTDPTAWLDPGTATEAAEEYTAQLASALSRPQYLYCPRLPGEDQYMAALDAAVRSCLRGEAEPKEALENAAAQWKSVTERLGIEQQRAAYRASLGI
jgi:multiple sugar transport system substrate-binding protein